MVNYVSLINIVILLTKWDMLKIKILNNNLYREIIYINLYNIKIW